jgi:putative tryptophan/tyrosine transport system substrate-binding protein
MRLARRTKTPISRRRFLAATSALLTARFAGAQQPRVRVGTYVPERSSPTYRMVTAPFLKRMAELGYEEGRNFIYETVIVPAGSTEAEFLRGYRELAAREVDVFLAIGPELALKAALAVAGAKPIVMIAVNWDPLAKGYVAGLRRPGRNVTGVVFREVELTTKRFQLLKEMLPGVDAVTVFWDKLSADQWQEAQAAAARVGVRVHGVKFESVPYDFERGFAAVPQQFRKGLIAMGSPHFARPERKSLPGFASRQRIPAIYFMSEYVDFGGLLSYGPHYPEMFARAADYVHQIAGGAKTEELPIEQPTRYELVINLKAAREIGVAVPPSILLRADRVIE